MYTDYNVLFEQLINGTMLNSSSTNPQANAIIKVMMKHGITGLKAVAFLSDLLTEFAKAEEAEQSGVESEQHNEGN